MEEIDFLKTKDDFLIQKNNFKIIQNQTIKTQNMLILFCTNGNAFVEVNLQKKLLVKNGIIIILPRCYFKISKRSDNFSCLTQIFSIELMHEALTHLENIMFPFLQKNFHILLDETTGVQKFYHYTEIIYGIYIDKECDCRRELILLQL